MEEEKTFFVRIGEPNMVRKELLNSSKDIISVLKNYDQINAVRSQKIEKVMELKKVLIEIKRLSSILKEKFPTEKIKKPAVAKTKPKKKAKKTVVKQAPPKKEGKIQKLEEELSEIEQRLNNMTV